MIAPPAPPKNPQSIQPTERPWSVTMLGVLLLFQGLLLLALGLLSALALYFFFSGAIEEITQWTGLSAEAQRQALPDWIATLVLLPLSLLSLVAAVGFLRLARNAWLYAMFVQGAILFTSLIFYYRGKPDYATMAFSIFIVLYLNYAEVRASFNPLPESSETHP